MAVKMKVGYEAISRRSIQRKFLPNRICDQTKKVSENEKSNKINAKLPKEGDVNRICAINPVCMYAKFSRFFVGKLVVLVCKKGVGDSTTGYYQFIHDDDRKALNDAAGWSDNKKQYLLERPKLKQ